MYSLLPGIVAGYFLIIGVLVWSRAERRRAHLTFLLFCVTTFVWQMAWSVLFSTTDPDLAILIIKFGYLMIIFLPTSLYHFLVEVSRSYSERRYVYLSYIFSTALALLLLFSDLFVAGYYEYYWGYYPRAGEAHFLHLLQTAIVVSRGLYIAYRKQQQAEGPLRSELRYCVNSLLIYFLAAVDYLCNYGFEFYPPGILFITISLTIIAYALLKKELLDIQLVITRLGAYVIVAALVIITIVTVNMLPLENKYLVLLMNAAVAMFWAVTGDRLREKLQTTTEQKWVYDWYDPGKIINDITRRLSPILDHDAVLLAVEKILVNAIPVRQAYVLIRKNGHYQCYEAGNSVGYRLSGQHPLVAYLEQRQGAVARITDLPEDVRYAEGTPQCDPDQEGVLLSLRPSGRLEGVIMLGLRISEAGYSRRDMVFFETVARQTEVFLDRTEVHQRMMQEALRQHEEKLILTKAIAGNIAHELRTPLATISMAVKGMERYWPALWKGYEQGTQTGQAGRGSLIPYQRKRTLEGGLGSIERSVRRAQTIITLLLANVRSEKIDEEEFQVYSMKSSVERALEDYPFTKEEKGKISFKDGDDFFYRGSDTLMIYVFYNLLKNAFYYIAQARKGEVDIRLERDADLNRVRFRDGGGGISPEVLPHIFEEFYSTKPKGVGNGLGLSFCKRAVAEFGGTIECNSVYGEYTEFVISLPALPSEEK